MNNDSAYPDLSLESWRETRDTLWGYPRVLGAIRRANASKQPHWWHVTLHTNPAGYTTTEFPASGSVGEIRLDVVDRQARLFKDKHECKMFALEGQSAAEFYSQVDEALVEIGIAAATPEVDLARFPGGDLDVDAIDRFWRALRPIDATLKSFKESLVGRTSPVHLFPHNFDHSLLWFSGRLVPGQDPSDEESAEEQLVFSFSTGDGSIPEPYFYATAYPEPDGFVGSELPDPAFWNSDGFSGAVLTYAGFRAAENPEDLLSDFLQSAHRAGASRMTD